MNLFSSFQHSSNNYTLTDEYYLCLSSDAGITQMTSHWWANNGNLFDITGYHNLLKTTLIIALNAFNSKTSLVTLIYYYRIVKSMTRYFLQRSKKFCIAGSRQSQLVKKFRWLLMLKLRVFLAEHTVTMVTFYIAKMRTCSPILISVFNDCSINRLSDNVASSQLDS